VDLTRLPFLSGSMARDAEKPRIAHEGQQAIDFLHGKHYVDCLRGRIFSQATSPVGVAIPIYSTAAGSVEGGLPLWNPPGSGVVVELLRIDICYASGTADYGSIGIMAMSLNGIGTATGCSAFAAKTPMNGYLLGGQGSRVVSSNLGTVTVSNAGTVGAPTAGVLGAGWVRTIADQNLEAQTGTPLPTGIRTYDFDGTLIVPPGVMIYLAAMRATTAALFATCMAWKEVPIVQ
jgi:hypothetical protein